jgi:hypothetical protein
MRLFGSRATLENPCSVWRRPENHSTVAELLEQAPLPFSPIWVLRPTFQRRTRHQPRRRHLQHFVYVKGEHIREWSDTCACRKCTKQSRLRKKYAAAFQRKMERIVEHQWKSTGSTGSGTILDDSSRPSSSRSNWQRLSRPFCKMMKHETI